MDFYILVRLDTQEDVTALEILAENLLRFLLGSRAKTHLDMFYLESSATHTPSK